MKTVTTNEVFQHDATNAKPRKARTPKIKIVATPKAKVTGTDNLAYWCMAYVGLAAVISMGLNAWANGHHATEGTKLAAWGMGAAIPVLVLLLGKVAGLTYKRGNVVLSVIAGSVGVLLLALSVCHCYQSISLLTGSGWILSSLLAIGIDAGMVIAEVISVVED